MVKAGAHLEFVLSPLFFIMCTFKVLKKCSGVMDSLSNVNYHTCGVQRKINSEVKGGKHW